MSVVLGAMGGNEQVNQPTFEQLVKMRLSAMELAFRLQTVKVYNIHWMLVYETSIARKYQ